MPSPFSPQDIISLAVEVDRGTAPELLSAHLRRLVEEYAFQNSYCDPDERLREAPDFPGYLVTESGQWQIYVPWALAFAFPSPTTLDGLVAVAERSMVRGPGNVVLSGSTTFAGRFAGLGDIDLAQYIFDDDAHEIASRVDELVSRNSSTVLVRVRFSREYFAPWGALVLALQRLSSLATATERMKFDFVDGKTPFGLMPISNIVLPSDPTDHSKGAARRSYVFQEAVLTLDKAPPWLLVMADELLRYLKFLTLDIATYRSAEKPIKALKRTLSLTRILGLDDLGTRAEAVLASESANLTSQEACLKELDILWQHLSVEQRTVLDELLKEKKGIATSVDVNEPLTTECLAIVDDALDRMNSFLSHEGQSLEEWTGRRP